MRIDRRLVPILVLALLVLTGCATSGAKGLSEAQIATLGSLERVDDYPLYTMHYYAAYDSDARPSTGGDGARPSHPPTWACSLFAALADADHRLYGRNFDWRYSPALLLFTDPPGGYASVTMVDIGYLGFDGDRARTVAELPLAERRALLDAPHWPFDGMNEHGLAVGMAAVPASPLPRDPGKPTVGSLAVIREMLDRARDVDEALGILQKYNLSWSGGPPLHYLIADRTGRAALVEFYEGELVVFPNDRPWHQATNFMRAAAGPAAQGQCRRYDEIHRRLDGAAGRLTAPEAMALLADVAQESTQWSVVYGMASGQVDVALGRRYDAAYTFHLEMVEE